MIPTSNNIYVVAEYLVVNASIEFGPEENSFSYLLTIADEYRDAKMTPMFLWDIDNSNLYCVAKETFGKKLH